MTELKPCPFCEGNVIEESLDLINRLQASKEHYQKMCARNLDNVLYLSKQCDELQEENEELKRKNAKLDYVRIDATPPKALIESLTADNTPPTDVTEFPSASFFFELEQQRERAERFKQQWIAEIKAEAYKEFAKHLKEIAYLNSEGEIIVFGEDIDILLKEMEGDTNG